MKRKLLAFSLVLLFIANSTWQASANDETSTGGKLLKEMVDEIALSNQEDIIIADDATKKQNSILSASLSVKDKINSDDEMYNAYGGEYIDDKGDLIVCMTTEDAMQEFSSCVDDIVSSQQTEGINDANIKCKLVSNTGQSLDEIYDQFNEIFSSVNTSELSGTQNEFLGRMVSYGIDYENNCINVYVQNYSQADKEVFESIFGKQDLVKYHSQDRATTVATYKPGRDIYVASTKDGSSDLIFKKTSIAYRAKKNNRAGFVTCAHGIYERSSNFVYSANYVAQSNIIGRVYENGYETNSDNNKLDYSFVLLMNDNMVSNEANSTTVSTIVEVVQGMKVWKIGSTSGITSSTVTEPRATTRFSSSYPGWTMVDVAKTGDFCKPGDSGGLVYSQQTSGSTYQIAGIVSGRVAGVEAYFTRADSVYEATGIVAY